MPLHVQIRVNRTLLSEIHITRAEGGTDPDDVNTYIATIGEDPTYLDIYEQEGVYYKHRYGDGAEVCVRKAIEALEPSIKT
jgi:hypothetical protein